MGDSGHAHGQVRLAAEAWIDVFSGRPAPRWILTEDETEELVSILDNLAPTAKPPAVAGLGYRGMSARLPGSSEFGVLRAANGVVAFEAAAQRALGDPERQVEAFLWDSARRHLPAEITGPLESHVPARGGERST